MLVTVVGVFLAVELPQAVTLILLIVQYTFRLRIFTRDAGAVASLVCNLVILLSYPTIVVACCADPDVFATVFYAVRPEAKIGRSEARRLRSVRAELM